MLLLKWMQDLLLFRNTHAFLMTVLPLFLNFRRSSIFTSFKTEFFLSSSSLKQFYCETLSQPTFKTSERRFKNLGCEARSLKICVFAMRKKNRADGNIVYFVIRVVDGLRRVRLKMVCCEVQWSTGGQIDGGIVVM